MRLSPLFLNPLLFAANIFSAEPNRIDKPEHFQTLVNPKCSYCNVEQGRRADELRDDDRALAWIRGKHDGGAVPFRFFLVPYRVISDSYGVWVYDADAGFVRGFEPSYDFTFHGWRNGVMTIKHKDGTLFSALSGVAFDGPRKGTSLKFLPTIQTDWGYWRKAYPRTVAYEMLDKFRPINLPSEKTSESFATRLPPDERLIPDEPVIGLALGNLAKAYSISVLSNKKIIHDKVGDQEIVVLWYAPTKTAAIYSPRMETNKIPEQLSLQANDQISTAPFADRETYSHWTIEGRAVEGPLAGNALAWLPAVQCKWFAWAAEYPQTEIYSTNSKSAVIAATPMIAKLIDGERLDWEKMEKTEATIVKINSETISVIADSDKKEHSASFMPQTEFYFHGAWGSAKTFGAKQRVYIIARTSAKKEWNTVHALADEISMEAMSMPWILKRNDAAKNTFVFGDKKGRKPERELSRDENTHLRFSSKANAPMVGQPYFYNTRSEGKRNVAMEIFDAASFENERAKLQKQNRDSAAQNGLVATVVETDVATHRISLLIRRADSLFARILKKNDKVRLAGKFLGDAENHFEVVDVRPDYSRTRLRLEIPLASFENFHTGETIRVFAPLPENLSIDTPPDLGRFTARLERIDYFMSTIYCPCGMLGTSCAGHWNTLAACKLHGCGMPNLMTREIGEWIDAGKSDEEILATLIQRNGKIILAQHQQW